MPVKKRFAKTIVLQAAREKSRDLFRGGSKANGDLCLKEPLLSLL